MKIFQEKLWAFYLSLLCTLLLVFLTDLIPDWGKWYSDHLAFRWQTERILDGQFAISHDPSSMEWDFAWGKGAVQQIWGLGVPIWRAPFEAIAKMTGSKSFPDRLAFILAFAGMVFSMTKFHTRSLSDTSIQINSTWSFLGLLPTVLFPPFVSLCSSRFMVYEEVVAYGFVMALLLMVWTALIWLHPNPRSFMALALLSGLIPLIRPTFGVYGAASLIVAGAAFLKMGRRGLLWTGVGLYLFGVVVLMWTNAVRFGSPFEFGHAIAVNGSPEMRYASRFGNPFDKEPILSAAKELFALLFRTRQVIGGDAYGPNLFPEQSDTFRWRELYFGTYDLTIFLMIFLVWTWLLWRMYSRIRHRKTFGTLNVFEVVALWSALATPPLAMFYLRFPFISSRYLLDFGPAFSAACWVFFGLLLVKGRFYRWRTFMTPLLLTGWWAYEMKTVDVIKDGEHTCTWSEMAASMERAEKRWSAKTLPIEYTKGFRFAKLGIYSNGLGWNSETTVTKACLVLFVGDPECLILEIASATSPKLNMSECECIRAKIGLESLVRETITSTPEGVRIRFYGPKQQIYRKGIQMASVAMTCPDQLSSADSKFCLLKVSWTERQR